MNVVAQIVDWNKFKEEFEKCEKEYSEKYPIPQKPYKYPETGVCPHCGRCPGCGHGGYYPNYPPTYYYPNSTSSGVWTDGEGLYVAID